MAKKTYYLVDYENVGPTGLDGADGLGASDYALLFSTKNAAMLSTAILSKFNTTNLKVHEVPSRSQSVDMHLASYLGYLVGTEGISADYVIVSKDKDYDNVMTFWKAERSVPIRRQERLRMPKKALPTAKPNPSLSKARPIKASTPEERTALNNAVMRALAGSGLSNQDIGSIASLVVKHHAENHSKQVVYRALVARYGQDRGSKAYQRVKKLI